MSRGFTKLSKTSAPPFSVFCTSRVALRNGSTSITVTITVTSPPERLFIGNHIPLSRDCPAMSTDATPPTDRSLHTAPSRMPAPMKKVAGMREMSVAYTMRMLAFQSDGSMIPPTTKNSTDCASANGTRDTA